MNAARRMMHKGIPKGSYKPWLIAAQNGSVGSRSNGTAISVAIGTVTSWTDIIKITAGSTHVIGLKSDGTCVGTGDNTAGKINVTSWTGIVDIACDRTHSYGLRADGTVIVAGTTSVYGELATVAGWTGIKSLWRGYNHILGVKENGTCVAAGLNTQGQLNVSAWTDIIQMGGTQVSTIGLKSNGAIVMTAYQDFISPALAWTGITQISARLNGQGLVGLKADKTAAWAGLANYGENVMTLFTDLIMVAAGSGFNIGLKSDGTVIGVGLDSSSQWGATSTWDLII